MKVELRSYEEFVSDFANKMELGYDAAKISIDKKLEECGLTEQDIVIFVNAVELNYQAKEIADVLDLTVSQVRNSLKKTRKRFPQLRTFNQNLPRKKPFVQPKRVSLTYGEILSDGETYDGPNIEIGGMERLDEIDEKEILRDF